MIERKWFVPAEGMAIPDPTTRQVAPPKGMWVNGADDYWLRRVLDGGGDLLAEPPAGAEEPPPPEERAAAAAEET